MDPLWRIDRVSRRTPAVAPVVPVRIDPGSEREASPDADHQARKRRSPLAKPAPAVPGQPSPPAIADPDADGHVDVRA